MAKRAAGRDGPGRAPRRPHRRAGGVRRRRSRDGLAGARGRRVRRGPGAVAPGSRRTIGVRWPLVHAVRTRAPRPARASRRARRGAVARPAPGVEPDHREVRLFALPCLAARAAQRPRTILAAAAAAGAQAHGTGSASTPSRRSTPGASSPSASAGRSWSSWSTPSGAWSDGSSAPRSPRCPTRCRGYAERALLGTPADGARPHRPAHGRRGRPGPEGALVGAPRVEPGRSAPRSGSWRRGRQSAAARPATATARGSSATPRRTSPPTSRPTRATRLSGHPAPRPTPHPPARRRRSRSRFARCVPHRPRAVAQQGDRYARSRA